jgi:hypothetical protein
MEIFDLIKFYFFLISGVFKEDVERCDNIPYFIEPVESCVMKMNFLNCPASKIKSEDEKCLAVKTFAETTDKCGYRSDGGFSIRAEFWFDRLKLANVVKPKTNPDSLDNLESSVDEFEKLSKRSDEEEKFYKTLKSLRGKNACLYPNPTFLNISSCKTSCRQEDVWCCETDCYDEIYQLNTNESINATIFLDLFQSGLLEMNLSSEIWSPILQKSIDLCIETGKNTKMLFLTFKLISTPFRPTRSDF